MHNDYADDNELVNGPWLTTPLYDTMRSDVITFGHYSSSNESGDDESESCCQSHNSFSSNEIEMNISNSFSTTLKKVLVPGRTLSFLEDRQSLGKNLRSEHAILKNRVTQWDTVDTWKRKKEGGYITCLTLDPGGVLLVTGSSNGEIDLYDMDDCFYHQHQQRNHKETKSLKPVNFYMILFKKIMKMIRFFIYLRLFPSPLQLAAYDGIQKTVMKLYLDMLNSQLSLSWIYKSQIRS